MKNKTPSKYRLFILVGLVLLALSLGYSYFYLISNRVPTIEVSPSTKDLGDVTKEGFSYTFTVKNMGKKLLEVEKVTTSCGCTLATIESEHILPGESTGLLVTFNPKLMKEEIKGKVSRTIFIKSNDPENPEVEIKITANVV